MAALDREGYILQDCRLDRPPQYSPVGVDQMHGRVHVSGLVTSFLFLSLSPLSLAFFSLPLPKYLKLNPMPDPGLAILKCQQLTRERRP